MLWKQDCVTHRCEITTQLSIIVLVTHVPFSVGLCNWRPLIPLGFFISTGGVGALSEEQLFLIPLPGGGRGARSFWCNVGVTGQRSKKQDFSLLYGRMHTVHAHHPHCLGPIFCIYLTAHLLQTHTNTHPHTQAECSVLACVLRMVFMCGPGL